MKKQLIILLVLVVVGVLVYTYPTPGARAFAVNAVLEASQEEVRYTSLLECAEMKRHWVMDQMAGEEGVLQAAALREEIAQLKLERDWCARKFNNRYMLFRLLRLI